jgi:hypothetical protein
MAVPTSAACRNCGTTLTGRYCAQCGQKAMPPDLTLREFLHETTHELTNWDGKVPTTLATLLLRPGRLTLDFLNGRRARWLSPLRVYLICSIAFFAGKPLIEAVAPRAPRQMANISLDNRGRPLTAADRQRLAEGLPGRLFGVERLERAAADQARLNREIETAFSSAMFLLLPVFAFLTWVAWRGTRRRYPAHLYLALHLHAVLFAASLLFWIAVGFGPVQTAPLAAALFFGYLGWYGTTSFRRVFGQPWRRTILKTLFVAGVYVACLILAAISLLGYAVARM